LYNSPLAESQPSISKADYTEKDKKKSKYEIHRNPTSILIIFIERNQQSVPGKIAKQQSIQHY
jgi:hypothetical protein